MTVESAQGYPTAAAEVVTPLEPPDTAGIKETTDLEWINHALAGMWPEFQDVAQFMLDKKILPMVNEKVKAKTDKVKEISFQEFSLGKIPPRLEKIRATNLPGGIAKIHAWFEYRSDMTSVIKLETTLGTFTSGIKDLCVKGDAVVLMNPYEESSPGTASCSAFLVDIPEIDFKFAGQGAAFTNSIGLKGIIVSIAGLVMQKLMVLPNIISVNVGMLDMKIYPPVLEQPDPIGMMRCTIKKGGLAKGEQAKKGFSLKRSFENFYEAVDTAMGKAIGKDMTEYFQLHLGDQVWEPRTTEVDASYDFMVVDPQQKFYFSVWDVDVSGGNDKMSELGPYHLDQTQALSGKPLTFLDEDKVPYATGEFKMEWFDIVPDTVGKHDSMVIAGIRELKVKGSDKDMGKLRVKGKLGQVERQSNSGAALKDKLHTANVQEALEEVRERMQGSKIEESVINEILDLQPKQTRVSINGSIDFALKSADIPSAVLEFTIVEILKDKDKTEKIVGQKSVKISDLQAAKGMNIPSPMTITGSREIEAEIDLQLCGMVPGPAPGEGKIIAVHRHSVSQGA